MTTRRRRTAGRARPSLLATALAVALVASAPLAVGVPSGAVARHHGTIRVLSAGSLSNVMTLLGAAFKKDTGYALENTPLGSSAIANGVKSKTLQGDVFISASTSADLALEGAAQGNWINGYTDVGSSPVVLAYYPRSRFAARLTTRPWYDVITSPGFELGRTDPAVDPGGVLDLDALYGIGYGYDLPALLAIAHDQRTVYTEEAIPGLLQAGQLDAAFMYAVSAHAAHLPYVALSGTRNLAASYTVAALNGAPDPAAAKAFVSWLTSPRGASIMVAQGLVPAKGAHFIRATK